MLRARFGGERVVSGTIASETERTAPGKFIQRSPAVFMNFVASGEQLLGGIVARLGEVGFVCQFIRNEQTLIWGKLCVLAPFALVTGPRTRMSGK